MRVPTVSIQTQHSTGKQAVFIHWSGETNTGGSRVTEWTNNVSATQRAAVLRGILADAYHAGREDMAAEQ